MQSTYYVIKDGHGRMTDVLAEDPKEAAEEAAKQLGAGTYLVWAGEPVRIQVREQRLFTAIEPAGPSSPPPWAT